MPSSINLFTPLQGHHPMVTLLLDRREVIVHLMKDGNGKRTFELGPIVTMSCHPWDPKAKKKPTESPTTKLTRFLYALQAKCAATHSRPSGIRWSEDLFHECSQHNEPPIPGPSQPSQPHEDASTHEPEPEGAPMQSMEEPFGYYFYLLFSCSQLSLTPPLTISSSSGYPCLGNNYLGKSIFPLYTAL
ncbi:hypothetical protein O181_040611 [Austropuccinia psidii MF-1]|uniref:Uncharacterized protein n=1 Tax=Austropuccinia psidii MF-1 TaxID=1389203 RepID=A0A9Q3DBN5_9BASI|nr:hypothetical protein [Austropuccinia psidii MF-1]